MKRITAIAITLAAVLGCSYVGSAAAVTPVEMCQELAEMGQELAEMGGTIVDARNRGDSLENVTGIINGSDMTPSLKAGMTRIAVTIYSNPSLRRADVVAYGFKGCIDGLSEDM